MRAFRVAGQGLAAPGGDPLRLWAVQDSPPGAAAAALLARGADPDVDVALRARTAVALYNARTATAIVPAAEVAAYAGAQLPPDDAALTAIAGTAQTRRDAALAVDAVGDALDGRTLSRDGLHEALRRRLPPELLPWCEGCQSHHARRWVLVLAGLHGRLCLAGRAGRQPTFARTDQWVRWEPRDDGGAQLVRRYLRAYGPSTPAHFAQWAGLGTAHARALWATADLAEVTLDGRRAFAHAEDLGELAHPPAAPGVRLLAPGDPLLLGRDRERLLSDPAHRARVWRAAGGAGVLLADGEPAALWRARKQGRTLQVTAEPFAGLDRTQAEAAFSRLASVRGAADAAVSWA